jgi:predicted RecB family endonuclease
MTTTSPQGISPQQLAKHHRQQCINLLEKMTRYLFRVFRAKNIDEQTIAKRFFVLYDKLMLLSSTQLYAVYHHEMRRYIDEVAQILRHDWSVDQIADEHMSRLNRLQKLKNASKYKKDKHVEKLG